MRQADWRTGGGDAREFWRSESRARPLGALRFGAVG